MKFVVGLGNPGSEYERTRHNLGRRVVVALAHLHNANFKQDKYTYSLKTELDFGGERLVLALPETFMNKSGLSVAKLLTNQSILPEKVCVVLDDIETPWGTVRMKFGGGTSGHNGLKSIHKELGVNSYAQLRVGIGRPQGLQPVADFVLDKFSEHELEKLPAVINEAVDVLQKWCRGE